MISLEHKPARTPLLQRRGTEATLVWLLRLSTYCSLGIGCAIFGLVFFKGISSLLVPGFPWFDFSFFTEAPESLYVFEWNGEEQVLGASAFDAFIASSGIDVDSLQLKVLSYAAGGILPAIIGTLLLIVGTMLISLLMGTAVAIYLSEYSRDTVFIRAVRLAIVNLAGVPSIIYGLFGLGVFVLLFNFGQSVLAGWATLSILALPLIITASEEALRGIPWSIREASLALGATRWQTIYRNVLPQAFPQLLTSGILTMVRVGGETAPILFTAALAFRDHLPWEGEDRWAFLTEGIMALPYHLYIVATRLPVTDASTRAQYGTATTLLLLLLGISLVAGIVRSVFRRRMAH
jgi:phosphate transport system permease protein